MPVGYKGVWFNPEEVKQFNDSGCTQKFQDFVRSAFHEKLRLFKTLPVESYLESKLQEKNESKK